VKYDGFRMLGLRDSDGARLLSRNGNEFGDRFSEVIEALQVIEVDCMLDGETYRGRPARPA